MLCNFVFWKHFEWEYQKVLIMKIKELFSELHMVKNAHFFIDKFCRRLLIETVLYYRLEDYVLCESEARDNILKVQF